MQSKLSVAGVRRLQRVSLPFLTLALTLALYFSPFFIKFHCKRHGKLDPPSADVSDAVVTNFQGLSLTERKSYLLSEAAEVYVLHNASTMTDLG